MPTKRTKRAAVYDDDVDGGEEAVALLLKAIGEFMDCIHCTKQFTVVSTVTHLRSRISRNHMPSPNIAKAESPFSNVGLNRPPTPNLIQTTPDIFAMSVPCHSVLTHLSRPRREQ